MKKSLLILSVAAISLAHAEEMDRPGGIKIGTRMTLMPYVNFTFTHDSNVGSLRDNDDGQSWSINPGANLAYNAENWHLTGSLYYQYHAYSSGYSHELNSSSFGESLNYSWSNAQGGKGWSLMLSESYQMISQDDDASNDGGRGVGRDRNQATVAGMLERSFNERIHGGVNASYYYLHYDNKVGKYAPLYGWRRWTVGLESGYVVNKWTDLLVSGSYSGYNQDNDSTKYYSLPAKRVDRDSRSWSVMAGVGTRATERISYRVMVGYSEYEYSEHSDSAPTYQISGNWKMSDTWSMMALASRYFSPSETARGSSAITDSVSWGLAHTMLRGKLSATFDLSYRHQSHPYNTYAQNDYRQDIGTARFGLNYTLNRFVSLFGSVEYQKSWYSGTPYYRGNYDYDRWRGTVGFRLTY